MAETARVRARSARAPADLGRGDAPGRGSAPGPGDPDGTQATGTQTQGPRARGPKQRGRNTGPSDVVAAFDAAAAAWERLAQPYPLAVALLRGAEAALAAADRDGAAQRLQRVSDLAESLGARPLRQEATELARSARIRPARTTRDQAPAAPLGLTAREFEVLRLVTDGRSNPEIAARLFISPKTVSVHVSNILAKMGLDQPGRGRRRRVPAGSFRRRGRALAGGSAARAIAGHRRPLPPSTLLTGVPLGHSWHVEQWSAWEVGI